MKNNNKKFLGIVVCFLLATPGLILAQQQVRGKVTDATGNTLPGVTILVQGTTTGTSTDVDGNYEIQVPEGGVLVYSSIGYLTKEVPVAGNTVIDIVMEEDIQRLDEVVVIGYGTVRKEDATGSVSVVSAKEFNRGAITTPQELLMGKSAGVVITTTGGAPGSNAQIRIRGGSSMSGSNDPLIVLDGVPLDTRQVAGMGNPFTMINPNDIESFTVLKDASATAIYGSRASNGVIIITTKSGTAGKPLVLNYTTNLSLSTIPEFLEVMSGDELRAVAAEQLEAGLPGLNVKALTRLGTANTDWQDEIFTNSFGQDHNLSASGTYKNTPYRFSLGYTNQNGILRTTNLERGSLGIKVTPTLLDEHLSVDVNLKGIYSAENFSETGAVTGAFAYDPTQPVKNGNTRFGGYHTWTNLSDTLPDGSLNPEGYPNPIGVTNPVAQIEQTDNSSEVFRSLGNVIFDYKFHFLPELRANLNLGYDYYETLNGISNAPADAAFTFRSGIGRLRDYYQEGSNNLLEFYLNYTKDISSISSAVDLTGGYSWQHFRREGYRHERNIEETIWTDSINYANEYFLVSFFGRLNYSLLDRYLLTLSVRNDGSSRFSEDNRWGLFPAAAFAWKIDSEPFFDGVNIVNELKLRLGYGITGQQAIVSGQQTVTRADEENFSRNYYPYLAIYRYSDPTAYYQFGNEYIPTLRPDPYDIDIKWEETTTLNAGIDFGVFNGRISGSVDVYQRKTEDLLNFVPIAAGTNFSNFLLTNVGSLENRGVEVTLNLQPVFTKDWFWMIGTTVSYNKNEITKLTAIDDPAYTGVSTGGISGGVGNFIQNNNVGFPVNSFFVFQQVYDTDGMPVEGLYVDRSGSGGEVSGNNLNKYHYKQPAPDVLMGITSRVNYKNLDFTFSGRLSLGNYVYNNVASDRAVYSSMYNQSGFFNNLPKQVEDTRFVTPQYFSDFYIENGSFFRMDNMSIGYNISNFFSAKLAARLSFTVQNAFIITEYKGLDPEVENGIDNNVYPRPRVFVLGINVTL